MGLRHHKGLLFAVGHDGKLDCLFPKAPLFAVVGHDGGDGGGRALVSEDAFGLLQVVEVAEVYAHHVLPRLGLLVRLLCLLEGALGLFGLPVFDLDRFGGHFVHDWGGLLEHLQLKVKSCCFFVVFSLFVDLSCFEVLLEVFADDRNIGEQRLVLDVSGDVEPSLDVSQFYRRSGDARKAFNVVLFYHCLWDAFELRVDH